MSSSTPASSATVSRSTPSRSAARATVIASMRSDLPRSRPAPALAGHQPGQDAQDPLAMDEQEPLERAGDAAAVLQRPDPLGAQAGGPIERRGEPAITDRDRRVAEQLASGRADGGEGVRALMHVRTDHDHRLRPFHPISKRTPAGQRLLGGGATLRSSHARTSRSATSDTAKASQANQRPTA